MKPVAADAALPSTNRASVKPVAAALPQSVDRTPAPGRTTVGASIPSTSSESISSLSLMDSDTNVSDQNGLDSSISGIITFPDRLLPSGPAKKDMATAVQLILTSDKYQEIVIPGFKRLTDVEKEEQIKKKLSDLEKSVGSCSYRRYFDQILERAKSMLPPEKGQIPPKSLSAICSIIAVRTKTLDQFFQMVAKIVLLPLKHNHCWMQEGKELFERRNRVKLGEATTKGARKSNFIKMAHRLVRDRVYHALNRELGSLYGANMTDNKAKVERKGWAKSYQVHIECTEFEGKDKTPATYWISRKVTKETPLEVDRDVIMRMKDQGIKKIYFLEILDLVYKDDDDGTMVCSDIICLCFF